MTITSTINPAIPADGSNVPKQLLRNNNQAAINDINNLLSPSYVTVVPEPNSLNNYRTLTGTANEIVITDGGPTGAITLSISNDLILPGTNGLVVPVGTTAQRPVSPAVGTVRFNTDLNVLETWDGTEWTGIGTPTIISIAGQTGPAITMTPTTLGTDFTISAGGNDIQYNLPDASPIARGVVNTGAQTFAGQKTFETVPIFDSLTGILHATGGTLTAAPVNLDSADVTGVLPVANGGTGSGTLAFVDLVSNQNVGGNKDFTGDVTFTNPGSIALPAGNTAQRPLSPTDGMIRYNTDTNELEAYINGGWQPLAAGGGGVTSINGLTGSSLTINSGTAGSDFNIVSAGSTITLNLPDAGAAARGVINIGTQTFAGNKTFEGSVSLQNSQGNGATTTLVDGATIAWDTSTGNLATITLGGNRTLSNPTNFKAGAGYILYINQDATGGRTLSFGADYDFGAAGAPTLTATPNAIDILTFVCDGVKLYCIGRSFGF